MPLFQLDAESMQARMTAVGQPVRSPSLGAMILRGMLGFMMVGVIGFAPWWLFETWFRSMREAQLYGACLVAFIAASGPLLHRLILGPGSLSRFYKLFAVAFTAYAGAWIAFWVTLRGREGEFLGLIAGSFAMAAVLAFSFGVLRLAALIAVAIAIGNLVGYYAGDWVYHSYYLQRRYLAMAAWGLLYGAGFGTGLGAAFYMCQRPLRDECGQQS